MKAKEYLQQLRKLDTVINQKMKEAEDLRRKITFVGSFDYSRDRVQTSPAGEAAFVKAIEKIVSLEAEINSEIDRYAAEKHKIINQIQGLKNSDYVDLLFKRYVEYKRLVCICTEMNFSRAYIKHLHGRALREFENKILNSTPKNTQ